MVCFVFDYEVVVCLSVVRDDIFLSVRGVDFVGRWGLAEAKVLCLLVWDGQAVGGAWNYLHFHQCGLAKIFFSV